jgi:hypothetical protein
LAAERTDTEGLETSDADLRTDMGVSQMEIRGPSCGEGKLMVSVLLSLYRGAFLAAEFLPETGVRISGSGFRVLDSGDWFSV